MSARMPLILLHLVDECETRMNQRIDMESKRPVTYLLPSTEEIRE